MELSRFGRENYKQAITTNPATLPTDWQASFDGGATWITATSVDGFSAWLVAGPSAALGTAVAVIASSMTPLVRLVDTPEIVVRQPPEIRLY